MSLSYNFFPVKGKIPWIVELESSFEVVEKLPQGGYPRWRGKGSFLGERISEWGIWKSFDKLEHVNVDLEQVSYFVMVG